jgi:DNA (cytosine-5)-methyltransferase 1
VAETNPIPAKLTTLSLFSGCGGFDDGFEHQGFSSLGAYDIDESAIEVYKTNLKGPIKKQDLNNVNGNCFDYAPGEVDVLLSGSPCQGFSTAGKREINDPRNKLLLVGGDIALKVKPKVFVAENVMGSLAGDHKKYWSILERKFIDAGFHTRFEHVNCKDIGLAQTRKRVLFFASQDPSHIRFEIPKYAPKSLAEVISNVDGLPNQESFYDLDETELLILNKIDKGQKLSNVRKGERAVHSWDIPEVFGKVTVLEKALLEKLIELRRQIRTRDFGDADPVKLSDLRTALPFNVDQKITSLLNKGYLRKIGKRIDLAQTFNGLYRRLDCAQLSYTVDTRFGDPRFFVHPDHNRGFTVREAARIQGFRDDFVFSGSVANQFKMIGNAVPPPLSNIIASILKERINGQLQ